MGDDVLLDTAAHLVLCGVAGRGISRVSGRSYIHPGMHANLFIHGVLGVLNAQKDVFGIDVSTIFPLSTAAAKYLPLPCLMADLSSNNQMLSLAHVLSGAVPFIMELTGNKNDHLGNLAIAVNVAALAYYSFRTGREWAWYCCASSLVAYYGVPQTGVKALFPIGLALMEYCAYRVFHFQFDFIPPPTRRGRRAPPPK